MKNNFIKFIYTLTFVLSSVLMFSQGSGSDDGDLEADDPPATPINSKLIILVIFGILFAFYTYKNKKKIA
jgi:hypothetical protein